MRAAARTRTGKRASRVHGTSVASPAGRSASEWQTALDAVSRAAKDGVNLVPPIIGAVEAKATLGEIADAMRGVFGEYKESATL